MGLRVTTDRLNPVLAINRPSDMELAFDKVVRIIPKDHFKPKDEIRQLLKDYTEEDLTTIYEDYNAIFTETFKMMPFGRNYITTVAGGGPDISAAEMDLYFNELPDTYVNLEASFLLQMKASYQYDLENQLRTHEEASIYWKQAETFIRELILVTALINGYSIIQKPCTENAPERFEFIRNKYSYETTLFHVTCRSPEIQRKEKQFNPLYDEFESIKKAYYKSLPRYLFINDKIVFFYQDDRGNVVLAGEKNLSSVEIHDQKALAEIERIHDENTQEGFWEMHVGVSAKSAEESSS